MFTNDAVKYYKWSILSFLRLDLRTYLYSFSLDHIIYTCMCHPTTFISCYDLMLPTYLKSWVIEFDEFTINLPKNVNWCWQIVLVCLKVRNDHVITYMFIFIDMNIVADFITRTDHCCIWWKVHWFLCFHTNTNS